MGYLAAQDMLQHGGLDAALSWHLSSNHYPPVPFMFDAAKAAIEAGDEGEDWDKEIQLPAGTRWRGKTTAPAWAIIEGLHLDVFLQSYEEVEEDDIDE